MIAIDTNILVYAHRRDSDFHAEAAAALKSLAESGSQWAIPWPCLHEFIAITTHPRIFRKPSSLAASLDQIEAWMESPALVLLHESHDHWDRLRRMLIAAKSAGPKVHDARVAALCGSHGVREIWTIDRDFSRFSGLRATNPLSKRTP